MFLYHTRRLDVFSRMKHLCLMKNYCHFYNHDDFSDYVTRFAGPYLVNELFISQLIDAGFLSIKVLRIRYFIDATLPAMENSFTERNEDIIKYLLGGNHLRSSHQPDKPLPPTLTRGENIGDDNNENEEGTLFMHRNVSLSPKRRKLFHIHSDSLLPSGSCTSFNLQFANFDVQSSATECHQSLIGNEKEEDIKYLGDKPTSIETEKPKNFCESITFQKVHSNIAISHLHITESSNILQKHLITFLSLNAEEVEFCCAESNGNIVEEFSLSSKPSINIEYTKNIKFLNKFDSIANDFLHKFESFVHFLLQCCPKLQWLNFEFKCDEIISEKLFAIKFESLILSLVEYLKLLKCGNEKLEIKISFDATFMTSKEDIPNSKSLELIGAKYESDFSDEPDISQIIELNDFIGRIHKCIFIMIFEPEAEDKDNSEISEETSEDSENSVEAIDNSENSDGA
ncbi:hypothetical protein ACQ4LE_004467 [Meloidogyne hapla]